VRDKIYKQRGEPQLQEAARSPMDDDSWEREMEGSGLGTSDGELINQLYVSLGTIKAGNTSTKLRKQVGFASVAYQTQNDKQISATKNYQ